MTRVFFEETMFMARSLVVPSLTDDKVVDTPIELHAKFFPTNGIHLDTPTVYRALVGCLVYLTITRPDIVYAVHAVSQFVSPRSTH